MGYFLLVIAALLLIFSTTGFIIATVTVHKKRKTDYGINEYRFRYHEPGFEKKVLDWIKSLDLEYHTVKSPYFYNLNVLEIKQNENPEWIILHHGVTVNHKSMLDLAYVYFGMGYNILLPDARYHGKSGGKCISYGYYEKYDLRACVDYLRNRYGKKIKIGMHGISMGASVILSYATGVRDDCDFYIADCPYSKFERQLFAVVKRLLKMPDFIITTLIFFSKMFFRIFYGYDITKIDIGARIQRMENPVLFTTCRLDGYIDYKMTGELYEKCQSEVKKYVLYEDGGHAEAFCVNREEYIKMIGDFLVESGFRS